MKAPLLVLLGLVSALPAAAQQEQRDEPADDAALQRERAIERCEANRGSDCES